jgi:hypothetical protein
MRCYHGLLIGQSGGRARVLEHGIALERVGAIRVADVHHDRRNEEAREKVERGTEKRGLLKEPESMESDSDGNRREGGQTGRSRAKRGREGRGWKRWCDT